MANYSRDILFTKVSNGATAGQTEVDSSILDMSGYQGVIFIVDLATVVDASVLTLTVQQNTANSTSGMAAITGASCTFTASGSSNTIMFVDVYEPLQRYLRAAFTRTAQNATVNTIVALQYKSMKKPTVQGSTVLASAFALGS